LNRPYATFDGIDLYPTPEDKAAALLHGIVTGHPFVDGNKRTGYALARLLLQDAGLDIRSSQDEKYDLVIRVATGTLDAEGVRSWLQGRVVPLR
jgi:death-on-curing protein